MILLLPLLLPGWLSAKVIDSTAHGFTIQHSLLLDASPMEAYQAFVDVSQWYDAGHSYSGSAANFYLQPQPGGCLCERLPEGGGVQHMQVVFVAPGQMVRLSGGLGPLQAMAVSGSMSWTFQAEGDQTRLTLTYTVGGYRPGGLQVLAGPVDGVLGHQASRLQRYLATGSPAG
ncbi:MAG: SRPBCC domain-containing protein [Bacteroidetes bacterium]|nr:MAG: SRPBCC domain-containing protein [Bacteroidota bacterium]